MKNLFLLYGCFLLFIFATCETDPAPPVVSICEKNAIMDQNLYDNGPDDKHQIESISLNGHCLEVVYWGGCDRYEMKLVASEGVKFSNPPQYDLRFSFRDSSLCEALLKNTESFDLSPVVSEPSAIINVKDWPNSLVYTD